MSNGTRGNNYSYARECIYFVLIEILHIELQPVSKCIIGWLIQLV